MVERQPSKLHTRVRFPLPAPPSTIYLGKIYKADALPWYHVPLQPPLLLESLQNPPRMRTNFPELLGLSRMVPLPNCWLEPAPGDS